MRRYGGWMAAPGTAPCMLALLVALGGCQASEAAYTTAADAGTWAGGLFGTAWGGRRPDMLGDSLTVARVRGAETPQAVPLLPEPGNVWPEEEAPRATLANPDAALRGIPTYNPAEMRSLDSLSPPAPGPISRGLPSRPRGSSLPPPSPLDLPDLPQAAAPTSRLPPLPEPPRRADGRVVLTPQGPVVTSGGTDRVQSFTVPGGGTGIITRDGPTSIITGPDGRVQAVPTPR